jgi:proline iminopeptidase
MQKLIKEHLIPSRGSNPSTILRTTMIFQDQAALTTLPYLFMLPGGPGANHSYYADYAVLQGVANIVFYDPRGCGLSDKGDFSTYTMDNYVDDLAYIKQQILGEQAAFFLGKSYGAMCALLYALRYPQDLSKLILAAGAPSYTFLETSKQNILVRGDQAQQDICNYLWQGTFKDDHHLGDFFRITAPRYSWKRRHNMTVTRPEPTYFYNTDVLNAGFRNLFWKFDVIQELETVQCPTLILVGEEDWITDPRYSRQMASQILKSKLVVFKNADHSLESDVPEAYFGTIQDFIQPGISLMQSNEATPGMDKDNARSSIQRKMGANPFIWKNAPDERRLLSKNSARDFMPDAPEQAMLPSHL